jgi:hypothetical protein
MVRDSACAGNFAAERAIESGTNRNDIWKKKLSPNPPKKKKFVRSLHICNQILNGQNDGIVSMGTALSEFLGDASATKIPRKSSW